MVLHIRGEELMQAKLNPFNNAKISFPGFQSILDFTATGAESTKSVAVDGDTDKEYIIQTRTLGRICDVNLNADTGANYGHQYLYNNAGTISSARSTTATLWGSFAVGLQTYRLLTPSGFIKTAYSEQTSYSSGTTIDGYFALGYVYNSTANITAINFTGRGGVFTAGTRITVFARRSQS